MKEINTIGIIGAGNIGTAIAKGIVSNAGKAPSDLYLSRKRNQLLDEYKQVGYRITGNADLVRSSDLIILSVLPGQAKEALEEIKPYLEEKRHILVSVISAVSSNEIAEWIGSKVPIVRIMPNTAVEFGSSMTCIAGSDEDAVESVRILFETMGETLVIHEQLIPAATILAACGIAFFLRVIRAMSQGGIQIGFHADEAGKIAAQTAKGAAELLLKTTHHPETEIDRVTTPMGCTISGLNEMEHFGLSSSMIKGIVKSYSGISDLK